MRDDVQGVPGDERKQDIVSTSGAIPTWRTVWGRGCNLQEAKFPSPRGKSYVARALARSAGSRRSQDSPHWGRCAESN
jgi:hypothetical protein